MAEEYGIGRVPADVNPVDEAVAEIEAQEIVLRAQAQAWQATSRAAAAYRYPRCSKRGCTRPGTMSASLGPACPDHYDDLSG